MVVGSDVVVVFVLGVVVVVVAAIVSECKKNLTMVVVIDAVVSQMIPF